LRRRGWGAEDNCLTGGDGMVDVRDLVAENSPDTALGLLADSDYAAIGNRQ
jgi:hypothetical protein